MYDLYMPEFVYKEVKKPKYESFLAAIMEAIRGEGRSHESTMAIMGQISDNV